MDERRAAYPPPPSAGEGTLRSRRGERQRDSSGWGFRRDFSGYRAPLSRPGLTAGPPSPAVGGGKPRGSRAILRVCIAGRSKALPHPEVRSGSGRLEGALQKSLRSLEGSFEARRSAIAGDLRMRAVGRIDRSNDRRAWRGALNSRLRG
ncbi:hypothetical protein FVA80_12580 [Methylobacterium sp. WL1]|nr:hypothetical protein FVA80_12580 [Methylobacterium sp. WL1]